MSGVAALDLEEVMHSRPRLAILAYLLTAGGADFTLLRDHTGLTDGNLSTHLRKLEDAAYIDVEKGFVGRKPRTSIFLNSRGKAAFTQYLNDLDAVIQAVRQSKGAAEGQ
jgi:DNA-binding MarR family transcriptional regulator